MYGQTRSQSWLTEENWTIPVTGNSQQELTTLDRGHQARSGLVQTVKCILTAARRVSSGLF